ncbi:MAG: molybdenum cofactor guanylyltransferase [Nitrospirota bacterium]
MQSFTPHHEKATGATVGYPTWCPIKPRMDGIEVPKSNAPKPRLLSRGAGFTGVILAGGENRRMPTNKAFLEVNGEIIIERTIRIFNELFDEVIIVTNTPELFIKYRIKLVGDLFNLRGPLTGIFSGLLNARGNFCFVVACDMPFINKELMSYMIANTGDYDAVVPRIGKAIEPLHAIYSRECLHAMEQSLLVNQTPRQRSLTEFLNRCNVRFIEEDEIERFDPSKRSFVNLNTPDDLEMAMSTNPLSKVSLRGTTCEAI